MKDANFVAKNTIFGGLKLLDERQRMQIKKHSFSLVYFGKKETSSGWICSCIFETLFISKSLFYKLTSISQGGSSPFLAINNFISCCL